MTLILLNMFFSLPLEHAQGGFFEITSPALHDVPTPAGDQGTP
jgi:hypothetical protein